MSQLPPPGSHPRILLGCTGSVATIKVPELARRLKERGANVVIVPTKNACHFLRMQAKEDAGPRRKVSGGCGSSYLDLKKKAHDREIRCSDGEEQSSSSDQCSHSSNQNPVNGQCSVCNDDSALRSLYPDLNFVLDHDEWNAWGKRGDPVLHIQLRDWAQLMVIAPLDANTMAKTAQGLCDNLLTCIVRAWDVTRPLIFCPAMNTHMYRHPLTMRHTAILKDLGYIEVCVVSKKLACGDVGPGAMAELDDIVRAVLQELPGAQRIAHGPF